MKWIALLIANLIGWQTHAAVQRTYEANTDLPSVHLKEVLITAYNWADMDLQNATLAAAGRLRANLEYNGARVHVCFLPVIYDVAAEVAMNCFNQLPARPDIVLSLGESGVRPGQLEVDLDAANLDNNPIADDRGDVRLNSVIDRTLPSELSLRVPQQRLLAMVQSRDIFFRLHDAGGYVCNNTAFRLGSAMQARQIPYMFVHIAALPDHGYDASSELDEAVGVQSGDVLTKMLSLLTTAPSAARVRVFR